MTASLDERYRACSLWLDGVSGSLAPRALLAGDTSCDVAVVGAGFTGLWTAYYLKRRQPDLRVVVLEREIAGFGPSGRNGGWVSAGIAGDVPDRRRDRRGREARSDRLRVREGWDVDDRDDGAAARPARARSRRCARPRDRRGRRPPSDP